MRETVVALCFVVGVASVAKAEESATPTLRWRVIGLFAPEREAAFRAAVAQIPEVKIVALQVAPAEVELSFDPQSEMFRGGKPEQILQRFDNRLRTLTNHTMSVQPMPGQAWDQLTHVEIPIAGLDCQACCLAAYEMMIKIDGVEQATASFRDRLATAWIDPQRTNRQAIIELLEKRGVDVTE